MKITTEMIDAAAKAIERRFHRQNGGCDQQDGGKDCWKSMRGYAREAVQAALKAAA